MAQSQGNEITLQYNEMQGNEKPNEIKLYQVDRNEFIGTIFVDKLNVDLEVNTVIILDSSGSMKIDAGDQARRITNKILPLMFKKLSYQENEKVHLITFSNVTQTRHLIRSVKQFKMITNVNAGGCTFMAGAIDQLLTLFESTSKSGLKNPVRVLTISDGAVDDPSATEIAAAKIVEYLDKTDFSINSQAVRLFTSKNQPDTKAVCSLLQINNTTTSQICDIQVHQSDEEIATSIAQLFQSDNFSRRKTLEIKKLILLKFPWDSQPSTKLLLFPGLNIFWLRIADVPKDVFMVDNEKVYTVSLQKTLTLTQFQVLMEAKRQILLDQIKILKIIGTNWAKKRMETILNYFQTNEDQLEKKFPTSTSFRISLVFAKTANDRMIEGCTDSKVMANYLRGEHQSDSAVSVKPLIDRTNLKPITKRVGKRIELNIDVQGEPAPTISWFFGDKNINTDANMRVENENHHTRLIFLTAKRYHRGTYKIFAENTSGTDEATIEVNILDTPTEPVGPLVVSNVTKTSCTLKWQKPEDDGGSRLTGYVVEKKDHSSDTWVPYPIISPEKTEYDVNELEEQHTYHFCVKAINEIGTSHSLTTSDVILMKDMFDQPSQPGLPDLVDWNENSVELKWEPPTEDGGTAITCYIIELMIKGSEGFVKALEVSGSQCSGTIIKLVEGKQYKFCVRAVNAAGQSEPSESTNFHLVKARYLKPSIDRTNLKPITEQAGKPINFDVNVRGEPPAKLSWTFKDNEITTGENAHLENVDYNTKLTLTDTKRNHSGTYKIFAENTSGTDEATVEVNILDKPTEPLGPLVVSNVTKTSCTLKWQKPEDDGGSRLTGYVVEKKDHSSDTWVPYPKISPEETEYDVNELEEQHTYHFCVKAINEIGTSHSLTTSDVILIKDLFDQPSQPGLPDLVDWNENSVELKWEPPTKDGGTAITCYIIEFMIKGSEGFVKALEVRGNQCSGTVTKLVEGKQYKFCVRAVNAAGQSEPSESTNFHLVKARYLKPSIDRTNLKPITEQAGKPINFDVNVRSEPPAKLKWTFKDNEITTGEKTHLENVDYNTKLTLTDTKRNHSGTYKIFAENTSGTDEATVEVNILDKPTEPVGPLVVSNVTKTSCTLKWQKPEDDGGTPLTSYVVEKKDDSSDTWVPYPKISPEKTEYDANELEEQHKYHFCVKAINEIGTSHTLTTSDVILMKDLFDQPSQPGLPDLVDWNENSVELKWEPPTKDGGTAITCYIIEFMIKGSEGFVKALEVSGKQCSGTITKLVEGKQYKFCVRAVNAAGQSEPSESTNFHLVKARYLKPSIDRTNLKPITEQAGKPINFDVNVRGEPPAKLSWTFKDNEITTSEKTHLENVDYNTKLTLRDTKRNHSGTYKIFAENTSGTDEATVEVNILDKPTEPVGPLVVSNVTKTSCTLKWQKPDDDGGSRLTGYVVEKKDDSSDTWVPYPKISPEKTEYDANELEEQHKYHFCVKAINEIGTSHSLTTSDVILIKDLFDQPSQPGLPDLVDWNENSVELKWEPPTEDCGTAITCYIIEFMIKGSEGFVKALEVKGNQCSGTVTKLVEGKQYKFCVRAVNAAGQSEPSESTNFHLVKARYLKPSIDRTNLKPITEQAGKPINFDVNVRGEPPAKLSWTFKDNAITTGENAHLENVDYNTKLTLTDTKRNHSGTYKIFAENTSGTDEATIEVNILDTPTEPVGPLVVSNVTKTSCTLKWQKPEDDGGSRLTGYVVEKKDHSSDTWVPYPKISPEKTEYDVNELEEQHKYHFCVKAINEIGTSHSLTTSDVILMKDMFDQPSQPGLPDLVDWNENSVELKWEPPTEDGGTAITCYIIEFMIKGSEGFVKALEVSGKQCSGTITKLVEGKQYKFCVRAVNAAGQSEPSASTNFHLVKARYLKPSIDRTNLKPITEQAGKPINFDVNVRGEPPAKLSWTFKDNAITTGENTHLENVDYNTKLTLTDTKRNHSGTYKIFAENTSGTDEATVEVNILDKPTEPVGPLVVSNVTKTSCTLKWQKPEDDGGSQLTGYVVEKKDHSSDTWVPYPKISPEKTEYDVNELEEQHTYHFCVKAINEIGTSHSLTTSDVILMKDMFDQPSQPGLPDLVDWNENSVELKWEPPTDDGGTSITCYIIEFMIKGSEGFVKALEVSGKKCSGTITKLVEGKQYKFCVRAVNAAGQSEPSESTNFHLVKARYLKPSIDRTNLKPITEQAGKPINFDVNVRGEPPAKLSWTFKDNEITTSEKTHLENVDYNTKLTLRDTKRNHSGTYKIFAENTSGTDEATVEVNILDKPTEPVGPLVVSNVTKTSCTLKWQKPEDDGGSRLTGYVIEKKDHSSDTWVPYPTIRPEKTEYDANELEEQHKYHFCVKAINELGISNPLTTSDVILMKDLFDQPSQPGLPDLVDWNENSVELKWEPPTKDGGTAITCYIIEFMIKGSEGFVKALEVSGKQCSGTITKLVEGKQYKFCVRAVNAAGQSEPSESTNFHLVKARYLKPSIDRTNLKPITEQAGKPINFDVNVRSEPPAKLKWTFKDNEITTSEKTHLENVDYNTKLTLTDTKRNHSGTYKIFAENTSGTDEATVEVNILDKPTEPVGPLVVSNVTKTSCTLKWQKPEDDGGSRLTGYVVEKKDHSSDTWVPYPTISPEKTEYDANELEEQHKYHFCVKAINEIGTSHSLTTSDVILMKDLFDQPSQPGLLDLVDWNENSVELKWEPPTEDGGTAITCYIIEFMIKGSEGFVKALEVKGNQCSGTVTKLVEGKQYKFCVRAVNAAGQSEPSESTNFHLVKARYLKPSIDRTNLKPITEQAGKPINFDVTVRGEPPAKLSWTFEDIEITTAENAHLENVDYNTKLTLTDTKRNHSGTYKIFAENTSGTDEATIEVNILDTPTEPVGPLVVSNVTKTSCTLKWQKPEDDGGSRLTGYVLEKKDHSSDTWVPYPKISPEKTEYDANELEEQHKYHFCVKAINEIGTSHSLTTSDVILMKDLFDQPSQPGLPDLVDWNENSVELKWEPPTDDGGTSITCYIIEFMIKGSEGFVKALEVSGKKCSGTITKLVEGKQYKFCVRAVNAAGQSEPSESTNFHLVKARYLKPSIDRTNLKPITEQAGKPINFDVTVRGEPPAKLSWTFKDIEITTGENAHLENVDYNTKLTLRDTKRNHSGTYKIFAENTSGTDEATVEVNILDKPTEPLGPLVVSNVTKTSCTLKWQKPEDDGGSRLTGYVVEKKDHSSDTWVPYPKISPEETEYDVNELEEQHKYHFCVKAINEIGTSHSLTTSDVILIKDLFDQPSQPGLPDLVDWNENSVELKWEPPTEDGGTAITCYIIEFMIKGSEGFVKALEVRGNQCSGTITKLVEGKQYKFCVRAVNAAGQSEPSESTNFHLVKARYLKPSIDRTNLKPITEQAGKPINFDVNVRGEPPEKLSWTFEDNEITTGENAHLENVDYNTKLTLTDTTRNHSGTYKIFAENTSGTDEATVEVNILDKPTEPVGPLVVSNVTKTSCTLKWQKPEDDGGTPLTSYIVEKMDVSTDKWISYPQINSEKTELDAVDLEENHKYQFRVKAVNAEGVSPSLNTANAILAIDTFDPAQPDLPEMVNWIERSCFTVDAIHVSNCMELKSKPHIDDDARASLTEIVKIHNQPTISEPGKPRIDRTNLKSIIERAGIPITFDVDVWGVPPKMVWLMNQKEIKSDGNIEVVYSESSTKLTIIKAHRKNTGLYKIIACNQYGEDQAEVQLTVLSAPSKPKGPLKISDFTKNGCKLKWNKPEDDGGRPLTAYEVGILDLTEQKCAPVQRTSHDNTQFNIKGLLEGHEYHFYVKAINEEGDSESLNTESAIIIKSPSKASDEPDVLQMKNDDVNRDDKLNVATHQEILLNTDTPTTIIAQSAHHAYNKPEVPKRHREKRMVAPDAILSEKMALPLTELKRGGRIETSKKVGFGHSINSKQSLVAKVGFLEPLVNCNNLREKISSHGTLTPSPRAKNVKFSDSAGKSTSVLSGITNSTMVANVDEKVNEIKLRSSNKKGPSKGEESDLKLYPVDENEFIGTVWLGKDEILNPVETIIIMDKSLSMRDDTCRFTNKILPLVLSKLSYNDTQPIHVIAFATETQYYYVTAEQMKSLKMKTVYGTLMEPAVKKLCSLFDAMDAKIPIRILTIFDGEVQDREQAEKEAANLIKYKSQFTINSQAVRLFTSKNQPDTKALCSLLQMNNTTRSHLTDIAAEETDEKIATIVAQLFQSDNFTRCNNLSMEKEIMKKFPWYSQPLNQIILLPGLNIFWLTNYPTGTAKISSHSSLKASKQEPLTLTKFQDLMKNKLVHILDYIKILKVVGTDEADKNVDQILKYFRTTEDKLAKELPASPEFRISSVLTGIANVENMKNCIDPAVMASYLREKGTTKLVKGTTQLKEDTTQSEKATSCHHHHPATSFVQTINIHDPVQVTEDLLEKGQIPSEHTSSSHRVRRFRNLKFDRNCCFYLNFFIIFILILIIIFHCGSDNRNEILRESNSEYLNSS